MDRYIEVIGEGEFVEEATTFRAIVLLEVRASKDETALAEVADFWREAVGTLRENGILEGEMTEGGGSLFQPWHRKKQAGQHAARRIILSVVDFARLNNALEALEPIQLRNKERKTIHVQMLQPEFEAAANAKETALSLAVRDARSKAMKIADEIGGKLGKVVRLEEGEWAKRNSGFSGDEDWSGDSSRFRGAGGAYLLAAAGGAAPEPELAKPVRTIYIKCRVRFELLDAPHSPR